MITVNQEPLDYLDGMKVIDVLRLKNYRFPLLIIRVNGKHIPREEYHSTAVPDGADVQVLHLMSGG